MSDNKNIETFMDGNAWCAIYRDSFIDLQSSPAGFGDTPELAIQDLLKNF